MGISRLLELNQALLTAGWVTASLSAATVTLPVSNTTLNTSSTLRLSRFITDRLSSP